MKICPHCNEGCIGLSPEDPPWNIEHWICDRCFSTWVIEEFNREEVMSRSIRTIAQEIRADWKKVHYSAVPYLDAMHALDNINDDFYLDSGRSVVAYFLGNAKTWKGEVARRVKAELNLMLK